MFSYPFRPRLSCFSSCVLFVFALTSAATAAEPSFQRGVSIGHWLAKARAEQPYGSPWFGRNDLVWLKEQGFDHVRIPVDGRLWRRADGSLDEGKIEPFARALGWAKELGLGVLLDMHFLPGGAYGPAQDPAIFTDDAARRQAAEFWGLVARRFRDEGKALRFEVINEPSAPQAAQLNALSAAALAEIRRADRDRVVYVTSNEVSIFATVTQMAVPEDPNVAILLRYDDPMVFTHQRASWKQCPPNMPLVHFPGKVPDMTGFVPPDHFAAKAAGTELTVAQVDADFAKTMAWLREHARGKEIYLCGFGCYEGCPPDSRRNYIAAVRAAAERHGWGWSVWDYRSSFAIRTADGKPTAVLEGLFPR